MQTYYSPFEADNCSSLAEMQQIADGQATPDAHPAEVHKFVRHAIESAKAAATAATMTLLLIPASTDLKILDI
jgi:hypothetical protein